MTDPIADMLTRIRNANQNRSASCEIPASNMKEEIAKILKNEGFIEDYKIEGETANKMITLTLKYKNKERVITTVLNGLGIAIISTSKGIMTDKEARKNSLGGEVIAYVW